MTYPCAECGEPVQLGRPLMAGAQALHTDCLEAFLTARMADAAPPLGLGAVRRCSGHWKADA